MLVVHHSRRECFLCGMESQSLGGFSGSFTVVTNYGRDCLVDQCNAGQSAASGEIIMDNQDDIRFPCIGTPKSGNSFPDTAKLIACKRRTDGSGKICSCFRPSPPDR